MRKSVAIAAAALLMTLVGSTPHPAGAANDTITITGIVAQDLDVIAGANVRVVCYYSGFEKVVQASATGRYSLVVALVDCPIGTVVKTSVGYDHDGNITSYRAGVTFERVRQLTVANIKVIILGSVPEYDWASATLASGFGLGGVMMMRHYRAKGARKRISS